MKYFNYILAGLGIVLSSFTQKNAHKVIKVEGFYNDISPNEEWVLYRKADDWEPGELHTGASNAVHIPTGQVINIDSIFIERPSTFFFNNTTVAIPINGKVQLYNLTKKQWDPKALVTYPKNYSLLQFSLSEDRNKVALLLLDWGSSIHHIKEDQGYNRVELRIIDLKHKKEYKVEHYSYSSGESQYRIGDILWHGDQVIYSFQSELYYYQLGNPQRICFTNRMEKYAIKEDELIYETAGYGKERYEMDRYHYKVFSFKDLTVRDVELGEKDNFCIISENPGYPSYFFRSKQRELQDQDGFVVYQGKKVIVKEAQDNLIITKLE